MDVGDPGVPSQFSCAHVEEQYIRNTIKGYMDVNTGLRMYKIITHQHSSYFNAQKEDRLGIE